MSEPQTVGDLVDALPPAQAQAPVPFVASDGAAALMRIIERAAISPDFDVAKLEKLLEVKERWEATEARKAFVTALATFKSDPPTVVKNKSASFGQGKTAYDYADLAQVSAVISMALSQHGLSHRWEVNQADGLIRVTAVLTHVLGHSERVTLQAGADTSGSKNGIQAIGSTVSYLERYSLLAVTGLAARGQDNDGHIAGEVISTEQKEELIALMKETGADVKRFLDYFGVPSLDAMPAAAFNNAKAALVKKKVSK